MTLTVLGLLGKFLWNTVTTEDSVSYPRGLKLVDAETLTSKTKFYTHIGECGDSARPLWDCKENGYKTS